LANSSKDIQMASRFKEISDKVKSVLAELSEVPLNDFRLEQIELDDHSENWEVAVSYLTPNMNKPESNTQALLLNSLATLPFERVYKTVILDKNLEVKKLTLFEKK